MSSQIVRPRGHSANIFINYRREDSSGHAGRIFDALSDHFAGRLFMDVDTIEPGIDFVEAIEQAVGSCEVLIVVIGREWLSIKDAAGKRRLDNPEDFVRLEVESALERKIRVIPVLVEGAQMPPAELLPPSLAQLARRNAIELSDTRWAYDVDRLVRTVQKILAKDTSERALTAAPGKTAPPPKPVVSAVKTEAVVPPAPVAPGVAAKATGSPVRRLCLAALLLVAATGLATVLWMQWTPSEEITSEEIAGADPQQETAGTIAHASLDAAAASHLKPERPQKTVSMQTAAAPQETATPQQTKMLQPVPRPSSPHSTPLASTQVAPTPTPPAPSPSPSSRVQTVSIPMRLADEDGRHREKDEPMKKGDLILDGPGVERPQLTVPPAATYPPALVGSGRSAKVVLDVLVDENGDVADARVERASVDDGSADGEFRKAALAAVRQARFEPATKNGIAGKMWWTGVTVEFEIER